MSTTTDQKPDSIIMEVRRLKEANAAEHGFDLRKIAAAARTRQREHHRPHGDAAEHAAEHQPGPVVREPSRQNAEDRSGEDGRRHRHGEQRPGRRRGQTLRGLQVRDAPHQREGGDRELGAHVGEEPEPGARALDRKSTRLNSSHNRRI